MKADVLLVIATLGLQGCSAGAAQLSGRWVLASPGGIGVADRPSAAQPLTVSGTADGCAARAELAQKLGPECEAHEAEAKGAVIMTDDVPLGNQPTPGEVIWYCDGRTVVRVVLARCNAEKFRVSQVAVAISPR